MRPVAVIAVERAAEQLACYDVREPTIHDRWQIRGATVARIGAHYHSRHNPGPRRPCLAGDCPRPLEQHGYCGMHWKRVMRGDPVDLENWIITDAEVSRMSRGNPRFGMGMRAPAGGGR